MNTPPGVPAATVLVVDDDPGVREVVHLLLGDGYQIVEAASGSEALDIARARPVDLVILDVRLPGLDGIMVLERLRGETPALKVIMLTAVDTARTAVTAMKLGAFDYLTKPFVEDDLCEAVERALRISNLRAEFPNGGVLIMSDDPGWRASLSALVTEHSGREVVAVSLHRTSRIPDRGVVIVDLIDAHQSAVGLVSELARSRRDVDLIMWADETKAPSGLPEDMVVVRGRRRIADVLHYTFRRVHSRATTPVTVTSPTWKALHVVATAYATVSVEDVAGVVALSTRHLARVFREDTGFSLKTYLLRVRIEVAKTLLRESDANLDTIAEAVGLYDASHMGRLFRQFEGRSPGEYRLLSG
jgi:CheY-like chemotaxis protein/AraC-like DNA-binding protein